MSRGKVVLERFKSVRQAWPVVESRAGRDLGQYIKGSYAVRFKEMAQGSSGGDTAKFAEDELEALVAIQDNTIRDRYPRALNTTFTGDVGSQYAADKLSSAAQLAHNTQSWLDKVFGRKLPSQWTGTKN